MHKVIWEKGGKEAAKDRNYSFSHFSLVIVVDVC